MTRGGRSRSVGGQDGNEGEGEELPMLFMPEALRRGPRVLERRGGRSTRKNKHTTLLAQTLSSETEYVLSGQR